MAAQPPSFAHSPTAGQTGPFLGHSGDSNQQELAKKPNQGNQNLLKKVAAARVAKGAKLRKGGPKLSFLEDKPQYLTGSG